MKFTETSIALLSVAGLVTAQPHRHHHRHVHEKRDVHILPRDNPTALAFQYDGQSIGEQEVCAGIRDGTLKWAEGTTNAPDCNPAPAAASAASKPAVSSSSTAAASPTPKPTTGAGNNFFEAASSYSAAASSSSSSSAAASSSSSSSAAASSSTASSGGSSSYGVSGSSNAMVKLITSNTGVNKKFVDGTVPCSQFPSDYGAVPISWMDLGGWSGIQYVPSDGTNIVTATANGSGCSSTDVGTTFCSYSCGAGYQKSQWPSTQGATGQSIGGLECKADGFLYLTNPDLSHYLCIQGSENVDIENKLQEDACVCRTDYPGTESEVVPLITVPGSTLPLTCPLEESYYQWEGKTTSAEYYLNLKGIPVEEACSWGHDGGAYGNWAPTVLGVGTDASNTTWVSIQSTIQNNPSKFVELDFAVEVVADPPSASACFLVHKNGVGLYCTVGSPSDYDESNCVYYAANPSNDREKTVPGCTVGVSGGSVTYVFTEE